MKRKIFSIIIIFFLLFCFIVFLKGLDNTNNYVPNEFTGKKVLSFNAKKLFNNQNINSDELFDGKKFYLLNIWSSWCLPCRTEHKHLMKLSNNPLLKMVGLNYKDNLGNAKKFINNMGNPYSEILVDEDGTISIGLGAYGVPETFIINEKKIILKKFVGPLNAQSLKEIESLIE